ncbi:hypothetical protein [Pseudomonas sp. NPDC096950]|uniref:hypothetical protein n=1 Tax=Pseudomonas sp. NPDC096950 TaxID=3364485 RepID=UPI00383BA7A3
MKDKEPDVFAEAAAQMHKGFPVLVKTGIQYKAQLERLYPKGGDGKSSIARHPTQNVTDFLPEAHKALFDALERVLLDPTVAALPPIEQARLAAQLVIAESAARASGVPVHDAKRYLAGLTYVNDENVEADGLESGTNAPYYFGHSIITAFEAGAIWQAQQTSGCK